MRPAEFPRALKSFVFRLALCVCAAHPALAEDLSGEIAAAVRLDRTYPDVSNDTDAARSYAIQAVVVKDLYGTKIAGYKAGLTSPITQQRFGIDQPVLGVLPESGRLSSGATLPWVPGLKIEVEIGFIIGVEDQPAAMLPVIELPRLDYADMKQVSLPDIVATNVSAYRFINGPTSVPDPDVRSYEVSLARDGKELFSAFGLDALGDPLASYAWMVNKIRALRYELKPGMILITGALGRVTDAEPGIYVAHYGPLGELNFRIEGDGDAVQAPRQ
jgi:2-keto-4-pentenoate hydratase